MALSWRRAWLAGLGWLLVALALPAFGQLAGRAATPASAPAAEAVRDPLDRGTPRRAIAAFIRAAHRGDWVAASRYVQGASRSPARTEELLRGLNALLDRHFLVPLSTVNDTPEGALDDGLPLDRERVGPLKVGRQSFDIELVRVTDPANGPVWLVSADTLARVPTALDEEDRSWMQRLLPERLFTPALFDFSWADLVVGIASLVLPLLLLPPLFRLLRLLARRMLSPARRDALDAWYDALRWPAVVTLALLVHLGALASFGPTLSFRLAYARVLVLLLVGVVAWALHRFLALAFQRAVARVQYRGRAGMQSVLLLGERLLNALLFVLAVLAVLAIIGFDMKTALAGLGIVGVALALGAQKTIENILGGMMLLGDEAIAVGDTCRINNRLGTVEDITLRSVRFRTLENTLLSIPAGVLAQADLENFASRRKILAQHRLRLAYGTSAQQLRRIRDEIAGIVEAHPQLEHPLSRVRVIDFGPLGIELEIYANVLTSDLATSLAIREDLLLRAATAVEAAGARFADPAPTAVATAAAAP